MKRAGNIAGYQLGAYLANCGIPVTGDIIYCAKSGGAVQKWVGELGLHVENTISAAHDATTSGRNDTVILSPDSHTQAATLTWSRNMTHLVGAYPNAMFNHRSRIGHTGAVTPLFTVSGYGNLFHNIYTMYGNGSAANLNSWTISGNRNTFYNCHFGGPFNATEGTTSGFDLVRINGQENYFNHCVFGADTIDADDDISLIEFGTGSTRNVFEDCIFHVRATNAAVAFIHMLGAGGNNRHQVFKRCQFINWGATTMTVGIDWDATVGSTDCNILFDATTCISGPCTDVINATYMNDVLIARASATVTQAELGLHTVPA